MTDAEELFDSRRVLARFDNDAQLVKEVYRVFTRETPERLGRIREAFEARDLERLTKLAHSLKGVCATLYAEPLRLACLEVEMACRAADSGLVEAALPVMLGRLEELNARFTALLAESTS